MFVQPLDPYSGIYRGIKSQNKWKIENPQIYIYIYLLYIWFHSKFYAESNFGILFLCLGDPLTPIAGFCHHCKWLIINDQLSAVNSAEILSTFEKYRLRKSAENDSNQPNSHLRCKWGKYHLPRHSRVSKFVQP